MAQMLGLQSDGNTVYVSGGLGLGDFRRVLAALHNLTVKRGYEDIVLDFTLCTAAYAGPMLALCADVMRLRKEGVDFFLRLPESARLANLFRNSGWAHLISPMEYEASRFRGYGRVPAVQFNTPAEQQDVVNRLMDATLGSMEGLERSDLQAIEWSINEITDNVLVHSESSVGGLVMLVNQSFRRRVEFVVADAGLGVPNTLRTTRSEIRSDTEALERAIREGITRDISVGQGNGLHGSFQVARVSNGFFHIHSNAAHLDYSKGNLRIRSDTIPLNGTTIVGCMDCSRPAALGEALRFGGRFHEPLGYTDFHFEQGDPEELMFVVKEEAQSYGSRVAGTPVRIKLANLINMYPKQRVVVDFEDVPLVSSSFADEVLGKLFVQLGPLRFMRVIDIRNTSETVRELLERAILQRSKTGA